MRKFRAREGELSPTGLRRDMSDLLLALLLLYDANPEPSIPYHTLWVLVSCGGFIESWDGYSELII